MNKYTQEELREIFAKANGRCHLCGKRLAFANYNAHGARGAWEVDHSKPLAEWGTDHLNNLYPAHTSCNRKKQARSTRSVRREHGRTRAPMSAAAIDRAKLKQAAAGALACGLVGVRLAGPVGFWVGLIGGGIAAYAFDPES